MVEIEDLDKLERREGVRFALSAGNANQVTPELISGSLEMPNVSVIQAMVEMIEVQRSFEGYTKTVQTIQELNDVSLRNTRVSA